MAGSKNENSTPLSNSGIKTLSTGDAVIPSSVRSDGSTRKEIRIRPGYKPPEDQEVYRNRIVQGKNQIAKKGVPGADVRESSSTDISAASALNKNAKRREAARRRAAASATEEATDARQLRDQKDSDTTVIDLTNETAAIHLSSKSSGQGEDPSAANNVNVESGILHNPESEREKKVRNLKKKLRQARDLQQKKDGGDGLLPEQLAKVNKIQELRRELKEMGCDLDDLG